MVDLPNGGKIAMMVSGCLPPPAASRQTKGEHQAQARQNRRDREYRQRRNVDQEGSDRANEQDREKYAERNREIEFHASQRAGESPTIAVK
jgi:membrane protein involved in colicin uptake